MNKRTGPLQVHEEEEGAREVLTLSHLESRKISFWKRAVFVLVVAIAIAITSTTCILLKDKEENQFVSEVSFIKS